MKTYFSLCVSLSALVLSGCAQLHAPAKPAAPAAAVPAATEAKLPLHPLTPQIVYGVLASELAAQRGASAVSAATYLELARELNDPRLARRAAEFAMLAGQLGTATQALQKWVELEPDSETAREQLLVAQLRGGKLSESEALVTGLLADHPERAAAVFVQLARLTSRQSDPNQAYALVRRLATPFPELPEARFAVLSAAAEAGDNQAVAAEFDTLARVAPRWDLPVAWQVDRLRQKDNDAALAFLARELARRPQAGVELQLAYPRLLVNGKRFPEARDAFATALGRNPGNPDILYALGLLSFQLRDLTAAGPYLEQALAGGHPEADYLRLTLGQLAEANKAPQDARKWYTLVGPGQHYLSAQVRLAALDLKDGDVDAVLARMGSLDATAAEQVQLVLYQSQFAREAGRLDLAERYLDTALASQPDSPELLYERALVLEQRGDYKAAERDLRAYLKQKADDAQGLNALGYLLVNRTSRHAEGLRLVEQALRADPDNPMILDSMGWALFKTGRSAEALPYLERAYKAMPDPEVAAHLGEVLWTLGRRAEARQLWQAERAKAPDHPVLLETMRRFVP
ncbi:tetratricopeptide repeat protein [Crenobacter caeni]|uniref:Tetratricopeptide repeat protein n=1 Tax=Crenobacter caeni TaxID=2705474 RepID=A0A6B2KT32_9NEIS|nr:tetratricopeptide repeat protein [Crenobacter caeni]NDV13264.1 tetratricopeptide repeat protein [Crenobacter caeni]